MHSPRASIPFPRQLLCWLALTSLPLFAQDSDWRTVTDNQGRSIRAQLISANDEEVTVKREDGQSFTLKIGTLSEADQKAVRAFASKPQPIGPNDLKLGLSRGKLDTNTEKKTITLIDGTIVKDGMTIITEKWGYNITLDNKSPNPLSGLRAEYRLFATIDSVHSNENKGLKKRAYSANVETIPRHESVSIKSESIPAIKTHYNGNIISAKTGESSSRETLYGIWIRIYRGNELVIEEAHPPGLMKSEKW